MDPTSKRLKLSLIDAEAYARRTVQQLTDSMFVESVRLKDVWADVYWCYRDGLGWYVKIYESDAGLAVISHHEPERPLKTIVGPVIVAVAPATRAPEEIGEDVNGHS